MDNTSHRNSRKSDIHHTDLYTLPVLRPDNLPVPVVPSLHNPVQAEILYPRSTVQVPYGASSLAAYLPRPDIRIRQKSETKGLVSSMQVYTPDYHLYSQYRSQQ